MPSLNLSLSGVFPWVLFFPFSYNILEDLFTKYPFIERTDDSKCYHAIIFFTDSGLFLEENPNLQKGKHIQSENKYRALTDGAQWVGLHPANQYVAALIPVQDTCLDCGPGPRFGVCNTSHTSLFLSLSFSRPSPLPKNK